MSKICLQLAQSVTSLFGAPPLRDIDHRADHLNKLSARTQEGVADGMNVSNCSIGFHNSELDVAVCFLKEGPIPRHPELVKVFWVDSLHPLFPHRYALFRIETENSEHFIRPVEDLTACPINGATARVSHALRFRQICFTPL